MLTLLMSLIIPLVILYIGPFVFGLWYINKEITAHKLKTRVAWMVFLFCVPIFAILFFYVIEMKRVEIINN